MDMSEVVSVGYRVLELDLMKPVEPHFSYDAADRLPKLRFSLKRKNSSND